MTVTRWVFFDPADSSTYTVPVNPNVMSTPYPSKGTQVGVQSPVTGQYRVQRGPVLPADWMFGGRIYTSAHHDALKAWVEKPGLVHITDHFGRTWQVLLKEFAPKERYPTASNPHRYEYEVRALVFGQI